jgi:NAD(P)-dependent dehydrogenase (short-subunit alcohol dehydrogenase family)
MGYEFVEEQNTGPVAVITGASSGIGLRAHDQVDTGNRQRVLLAIPAREAS